MIGLQLAATVLAVAGAPWQPPQGIFPILGWVGPPRATEQQYRLLADAGFTIGLNLTAQEAALAHKAGLLALYRLGTPDPATPEGRKRIDRAIAEARQLPNCVGYFIKDEPNASMFPLLGRIVEYIKRHDPGKLAFINLFPTYASQRQLGTKTYEEYVRRFIAEVKPQVLCYDNYPCLGPDGWRGDYYLNMEIIRAAARRAGIPFWAFVLSVSHGGYRDPTRQDLALQAFSDLAYGARGVLYFTYGTPGAYKPAIVDRTGRPTHHFAQVRSLNAILRTWGLYIRDVAEVHHVGKLPRGTTPLPASAPVQVVSSQPAIVSLLTTGDGQRGVMIVNKNRHAPADVVLRLAGGGWLREVACPTVQQAEQSQGHPPLSARQRSPVRATIAPGFARLWVVEASR